MTTTTKNNKRMRRKRRTSLITSSILPVLKYKDFSFDGQTVTTSGHLSTLGIPCEVGYAGRVGYRVKYLRIEYNLLFSPSATDGNDTVRLILAKSRSPGFVIGDCPDYNTPLDLFTCEKPKMDLMIPLHAIENTNNGPGVVKKVFRGSVKLGGTVYFSGALYNDYASGYYFTYVVSDSAVTPYPTVDGWLRVFFSDQ